MGDRLDEWLDLDETLKRKFNGYQGFCNGQRFNDNNAFQKYGQDRKVIRALKERNRLKK